ncbi:MAG: flagellar biosynthesis anti-sigma factor FlgM [Deltaproteobacteria bacterium]|nr:flagellar biosynthesis anti-sigma factor FlgM [Deltaproteobacteria bacterium]
MKIHAFHVAKQYEAIQKKQSVNTDSRTVKAKEGDKVVFSEKLREMQGRYNDRSVDTQLQARIESVRDQIAKGSYAPDTFKVAESLLRYIME